MHLLIKHKLLISCEKYLGQQKPIGMLRELYTFWIIFNEDITVKSLLIVWISAANLSEKRRWLLAPLIVHSEKVNKSSTEFMLLKKQVSLSYLLTSNPHLEHVSFNHHKFFISYIPKKNFHMVITNLKKKEQRLYSIFCE